MIMTPHRHSDNTPCPPPPPPIMYHDGNNTPIISYVISDATAPHPMHHYDNDTLPPKLTIMTPLQLWTPPSPPPTHTKNKQPQYQQQNKKRNCRYKQQRMRVPNRTAKLDRSFA